MHLIYVPILNESPAILLQLVLMVYDWSVLASEGIHSFIILSIPNSKYLLWATSIPKQKSQYALRHSGDLWSHVIESKASTSGENFGLNWLTTEWASLKSLFR